MRKRERSEEIYSKEHLFKIKAERVYKRTFHVMATYNRNAMAPHIKLNNLSNFTREHFARWKQLFTSTVNELFEGEKAKLAKQCAISIATVMQVKLLHEHPPIPVKQ